jgi:hypothetical protein
MLRRRRRRRVGVRGHGYSIFDIVFFVACVGFSFLFLLIVVSNLVDVLQLRSDGVHVVGTSIRTWSETHTRTDAEGHSTTETSKYTEVDFFDDDGNRHVEKIDGGFKRGSEVFLVYHRGDPESVRATSEIGAAGLAIAIFFVVFAAGVLIAAVSFAISWGR